MPFGLNIGDLLLTILADGSMLQKDIERQGTAAADKAGKKIGQTLGGAIGAGLTKQGKAMSTIGKSMTTNLTVPIIAAGTAITMVGMKFDTQMRQIVALTDVTADEIGGVREEILKLAPAVGKSPQELAEAFYFLASGGFNAKESLDILTSSAKAAATGLGDTQDVAKVIGASINAFGKENLTATQATDQLIRAIKDGTAEAPDFAGALGDVVGSAGILGVNFGDTAGAIAAMTLQGISADEAATSLNQTFRALFKTTPQAAKGFAEVGLTVEGLKDQLKNEGLLPTLMTLETAFKDNDVAAGKAFGNVRALRGVLALIGGDNLESTSRILKDVASGTTDLGSAFDETEGPGRRWDSAMAQIQVTLISLSEDVLPLAVELIQEVAGILQGATDAFKALPEPVRSFTVRALALTAALGPLIWGAGKVTQTFGALFTVGSKLANSRIGTKIAATLFTPIVDAAAGLGARLTAPITASLSRAFAGFKGTSFGGAATSKLGTFMGSTLGKAAAVGFAAVMWVEVINTYNQIKDQIAGQNAQINADVAKQLQTGTTAELEAAKAAIEKGLQDINGVWDAGIFTTDSRKALEANLEAYKAELARRAAGLGPAVVTGLDEAGKVIDPALNNLLTKSLTKNKGKVTAAARAAGQNIPQSLAKGIIDEQNAPVTALDSLQMLMKQALTRGARIARDIGILTSKELAAGLRDKRPEVVDEAKRVRAVTEQDLAELILAGGKVGKAAGERLAKALRSKSPAARNAAKRIKAIVDSELSKTVPAAGTAGTKAGNRFAGNLTAAVRTALANAAVTINNAFANAFSGPGPVIPKDPKDPHRARGGRVSAGRPYWVNEETPHSEVFVPSVGGYVVSRSDALRAISDSNGGGGAVSYTIPVTVTGVLSARKPDDLARPLRQLAASGALQTPAERRRMRVPNRA